MLKLAGSLMETILMWAVGLLLAPIATALVWTGRLAQKVANHSDDIELIRKDQREDTKVLRGDIATVDGKVDQILFHMAKHGSR